jgi:hypothetical protein
LIKKEISILFLLSILLYTNIIGISSSFNNIVIASEDDNKKNDNKDRKNDDDNKREKKDKDKNDIPFILPLPFP